ncbi:hypothetical protein V2J09_004664 [Rumex salicifolius]
MSKSLGNFFTICTACFCLFVNSLRSPFLIASVSLFVVLLAKLINGKSVARQITDEIVAELSRMKEAVGVVPGLATILVGDRKDFATYKRNKKKACESNGINSYEALFPKDCSEKELLDSIAKFNDDTSVHGILVQEAQRKPGAVVIDVGINPIEDPDSPRGYWLVGDVCYEEVITGFGCYPGSWRRRPNDYCNASL